MIYILARGIYLKNHTAMPFQNICLVWAVEFRAEGRSTAWRVADILLFISGVGDLLILHDHLFSRALSSILIHFLLQDSQRS